jgi:hypothetical protein
MGASLVTAGKPLPAPVRGACECGRVQIELTEEPFLAFKCACGHCRKYRALPLQLGDDGAAVDEMNDERLDALPVVGYFRAGAVRVVSGADSIQWIQTRGGLSAGFVGVNRGYCGHCRTPGCIETFRDGFWRRVFGGSVFCYLGSHSFSPKEAPFVENFSFYHCFNSASPGTRKLGERDSKPKLHEIIGGQLVAVAPFANLKMLSAVLLLAALYWFVPR